MAVTQEWNGHWMGVDAHSAAVNAVNGPAIRRRFIDGRIWFLIKKNIALYRWHHILHDVRVQCNSLFKNKSVYRMGFRIRSTSFQYTTRPLLHFTAPPLLYCTVLITLHHYYSTALYSPHCTTTAPLHSIHCTELTTLYCTHYTALYSLHCTVLTTLHQHYSIALY